MNKYYPAIILLLVIGLTVMYIERPSAHDRRIKELEIVIRKSKYKADSLRAYVEKTKDSLDIAFATIRSLNAQREAARQETVKWIKKYESIHYKPLVSDRVRDSLWAELYPTR